MYKKISNNTYQRLRYFPTYALDDTVFTLEELDQIIEHTSKLGLMPGIDRGNVRKSDINFMHPNKDNYWIFERFNDALDYMNEKYFNFDINGYEFIQYSTYEADKDGRYDFHIDMALGEMMKDWHENRKLSMTLLLNEPGVDFEGGDFEFNTCGDNRTERPKMRKGTLILFPSFMMHRVTPVTTGIRKSLVIWLTGPKFK
jgi:PKHD-type hydroxylase